MSSRNTKQRFLSLFSVLLVAHVGFLHYPRGLEFLWHRQRSLLRKQSHVRASCRWSVKVPMGRNRSLWRRCH